MSTPEQRQQWRELAAAATPGEWTVDGAILYYVWGPDTTRIADCGYEQADAAFIAAARAAVPALLADVDALTQEVDRLMEEGRKMQEERDGWRESFGTPR